MRAFIAEVLARFGGRPAGTRAERGAQELVRERLGAFCDTTTLQPFVTRLTSHFAVLRPISLLYLVALALFFVAPAAAIALALLNALAFLTHFLAGRHWLDFLYPRGESCNVEGVVEPTGEPTSTLLLSGHIDSVYEFKWWYRLGHLGGALTVIAGFVVSLQWAMLLAAALVGPGSWQSALLGLVLLQSPLLVVLFDMHDLSVPVDGASDNLSGVALALELGRHFATERLHHTRLRIVSFGAEEPYLRGSTAFVVQHRERLRAERAALVNLDTIKDERHLAIVRAELCTATLHSRDLVALLDESFAAMRVPVKRITLGVGATDAVPFRRRGLPAVSVIGMDAGRFDPAYHTRRDVLDAMDERGLETLRDVLVEFVRAWDLAARSREVAKRSEPAARA